MRRLAYLVLLDEDAGTVCFPRLGISVPRRKPVATVAGPGAVRQPGRGSAQDAA